jgi:hypothetical protein
VAPVIRTSPRVLGARFIGPGRKSSSRLDRVAEM